MCINQNDRVVPDEHGDKEKLPEMVVGRNPERNQEHETHPHLGNTG